MTNALNNSTHSFVYVVAVSCVALSLLLALTMPTPARAAQLNETQIQAILNLLVAFDADSATIANTEAALRGATVSTTTESTTPPPITTTGTTTPPVVPPPGSCGLPGQMLQRGDRGAEVGMLQKFLASQGLLASSSVTAFFGPGTEDALKHWQAAHGVVSSGDANSTGWGVFGPKTRSVIARLCDPSTHDNQSIAPSTVKPNKDSEGFNGSARPPVCILTAAQTSVEPGASVTLTWKSTGATYSRSPNGTSTPNGSVTVTPTTDTTYQKTVFGPGGSASCQIEISVIQPEGSTTSTSTPSVIEVMAQPSVNLASVVAAAAALPFSIAINSLTDIFVQLGIGQ